MQFMVVAYDGKDEQALERRLAVRDAHIKGAVALKQSGNLIAGGAILDDAGKMIGSTTYVGIRLAGGARRVARPRPLCDRRRVARYHNHAYPTRGLDPA